MENAVFVISLLIIFAPFLIFLFLVLMIETGIFERVSDFIEASRNKRNIRKWKKGDKSVLLKYLTGTYGVSFLGYYDVPRSISNQERIDFFLDIVKAYFLLYEEVDVSWELITEYIHNNFECKSAIFGTYPADNPVELPTEFLTALYDKKEDIDFHYKYVHDDRMTPIYYMATVKNNPVAKQLLDYWKTILNHN